MQALVYIFIALAALGLGATGYYGLTLTPLEAFLVAVMFGCVAIVLVERSLRQRAENRLESAIEDLSRLLSTDAQAGAVLGQRINALADLDAGARLEGVEADISVLGTVIRQVAEAVSEIEERAPKTPDPAPPQRPATPAAPAIAAPPPAPEPSISLPQLREALNENRLIFQVQPVVKLPQRRPVSYDLVPRLRLDGKQLVEPGEFMPHKNGDDLIRQIEQMALMEAITIGRRARTKGQVTSLFVPLSRATLGHTNGVEQLLATLEANRAISGGLSFLVPSNDWTSLTTNERAIAKLIGKMGIGFVLDKVNSLRIDVAELAAQSVKTLRMDTARFMAEPQSFTDFHPADIGDYLGRFGVELLAGNVTSEAQILEMLDYGICLAQGNHIAAAGPIPIDLSVERARPLTVPRHAEI